MGRPQKISRREQQRESRRRREHALMFGTPSPPGEGPLTAEEIDVKYQRSRVRSFVAKFPGTCARCFCKIEKGDRVRYADDGLVHHRHAHPEREDIVCTSCHLVKPCDCDT